MLSQVQLLLNDEYKTGLAPMWIMSFGVFLCSIRVKGGIYMTMITIMEAVAIIGAGGGVALLSYLVGLNQGRKKTNTL